jgi:hypothetical protein
MGGCSIYLDFLENGEFSLEVIFNKLFDLLWRTTFLTKELIAREG